MWVWLYCSGFWELWPKLRIVTEQNLSFVQNCRVLHFNQLSTIFYIHLHVLCTDNLPLFSSPFYCSTHVVAHFKDNRQCLCSHRVNAKNAKCCALGGASLKPINPWNVFLSPEILQKIFQSGCHLIMVVMSNKPSSNYLWDRRQAKIWHSSRPLWMSQFTIGTGECHGIVKVGMVNVGQNVKAI